jgi:hypothetical protein
MMQTALLATNGNREVRRVSHAVRFIVADQRPCSRAGDTSKYGRSADRWHINPVTAVSGDLQSTTGATVAPLRSSQTPPGQLSLNTRPAAFCRAPERCARHHLSFGVVARLRAGPIPALSQAELYAPAVHHGPPHAGTRCGRYRAETRSSPAFSDASVCPSFLRTTPAKKPRTECCCHPVSFMMAAIVVP